MEETDHVTVKAEVAADDSDVFSASLKSVNNLNGINISNMVRISRRDRIDTLNFHVERDDYLGTPYSELTDE